MHKRFIYCSFVILLFCSYSTSVYSQDFSYRGLRGEYFSGKSFTDCKLRRFDNNVNFNWAGGTPDPSVKSDSFAVVWRAFIVPQFTGVYKFNITTGNGVRLLVSDSLLFDKLENNKKGQFSSTISLTKGVQYHLQIEFVKTSPTASIKLEWECKGIKKEVIPQSAFIPDAEVVPPVIIGENRITRDPAATCGPDGMYYMVYTSGLLNGQELHGNCWNHNDGLHVWRSSDMKNWTDLGLVWSFEKDATFQKGYDKEGRQVMWAPEIHYIKSKKNWYVTYSKGWVFKSGLFRSKTGKPEGPYEDVKGDWLLDQIDASLFEDEDGKVYAIYGDCRIALLNDSLNGLAEPVTYLCTPDGKTIGFEGSCMMKINGKYYVSAASSNKDAWRSNDTYDCMIAVSDHIKGPYSPRWLGLRFGGHNNLFRDAQGGLWSTMFGSGTTNVVSINPGFVRMIVDKQGRLLPWVGKLRGKDVLFTSRFNAVKWKYSFTNPGDNWETQGFNDSKWSEGEGGFGGAPASLNSGVTQNRTLWKKGDIWLRKTFNPGDLSAAAIERMLVLAFHDEIADVYINGIKVVTYPENYPQYHLSKISDEAKKTIKPNANITIAVHAKSSKVSRFIDVGLVSWE